MTKGGLTGAAAAAEGCKTWVSAACTAAAAATAAVQPTEDQKWTTNFLAGSYDLGVAKLSVGYKTDKLSTIEQTIQTQIYGVVAPVGALTLKAAYVSRKADEKVGNQFAVGAVYDLSKRTSLYTTYSVLKNEAGIGNSVGSAAASDFTGLKSKGFEAGVKHNF